MARGDIVLKSRRVALPEGVRPACIAARGGRITEVRPWEAVACGEVVMDAGDLAVLPGLVDTHVHFNDPGRAEWEGFEAGTAAAAAGGDTWVVDMPLNSIPPTTTHQGLTTKQDRSRGRCAVDVGFWGGVVPGNLAELEPMARAGALGFKAFLVDSGVPEFPRVRESDLRPAMRELARLKLPLLAHAEMDEGHSGAPAAGSRRYQDYLASRPDGWEVDAIRLLIRLCRETGCRVHIVHLSSADALPDLAAARREGLLVTAETCPHYLALSAEEIPDGATQYKCAPPIRNRENAERLWRALKEGVIDFIVSDHSPCVPELKRMKEGDFSKAWGGIASVQFRLPVVWTEMRRRGLGLADAARWLSRNPARFAGSSAKGEIAPGRDADFTIFDPDASFTLTADMVRHRHSTTPYAGRTWTGVVESVYLRGEKIFEKEPSHGICGPIRP